MGYHALEIFSVDFFRLQISVRLLGVFFLAVRYMVPLLGLPGKEVSLGDRVSLHLMSRMYCYSMKLGLSLP